MTDDLPRILLLANAAATLYMAGVIWFVQVVHYPLFARVSVEGYAAYQSDHMRLTTWVVAPPMLVELATAVALLWLRPASVSLAALFAGVGLLAVVWASTFVLQVPCHEALGRGFDAATHRRLVATNALRTAAWSGRAALVLAML